VNALAGAQFVHVCSFLRLRIEFLTALYFSVVTLTFIYPLYQGISGCFILLKEEKYQEM
jgi:hypothetical protein